MISPLLFALLTGLLGTLVTGVLHAFVVRSPEALRVTTRRTCSVCAVPVSWVEALPIVGYLAMKGRCRRCRAITPWHYPATELLVGLLAALAGWQAATSGAPDVWLLAARDAIALALLVLIAAFDAKASRIPDHFTVPGIVLAVAANLALGIPLIEILFGALAIGAFFAVQYLLSSGEWVGGGDVLLGLFVGALLGPLVGAAVLLAAYVLAAAVGIPLLATGRRDLHGTVPFGAFFAIAAIAGIFIGQQVVTWYIAFFS